MAADVVNTYLDAFYRGDLAQAGALLAPAFHFKGPFIEARDRETYLKSAAPLAAIVRGHRLLRQWVDGEEIASIYDVHLETPAGTGDVTMSEWHKVEGQTIVSSRLIMDSAALRRLMPGR